MHAYAPPPVRRGANKEETAVLPAINRHQPAIIIDTRCPHNESIYTDVDRYAILSPVRLSRDYATAANLHPPASCLFLLSSCANSILRVLLSLSLSSPSALKLFTQLFQIASWPRFEREDRQVSITWNIRY